MNLFKTLKFLGINNLRFFPSLLLFLLFIFKCNSQTINSTISLFDGNTLEGWKTVKQENQAFWSVKDSNIIGGDGKQIIPENLFLYTTKTYEDFELRCLFRLTGDHDSGFINSGIQYRSLIKGDKMIGYQADIGKGHWGDIYDEHRRGKLMDGNLNTLQHILNEDGWNSYIIRVEGNKHELYINGVKTGEYQEQDQMIPSRGVIGIQLHSGGAAKIEFRDITISPL